MEQVKRNARVNSHIEKSFSGKVVRHLYKGMSQALVGMIFQSDAGDYYHVSIKRPEGTKVYPHLSLNQKVEVTLTGDEKLLEEIMYYTSELITIQNKLDIRLKGLAHLKSIKSPEGSYTLGEWSYFSDKPLEEVFQEDIAIVKKRKIGGTHWAYILENEDTILVPYQYDHLLKNRKTATYITMRSMSANGTHFKSPNIYEVLAGVPFSHDRAQRSGREMLIAKAAIILEQGGFEYLTDLLGYEMDFEKVQNVFVGNTVLDLRDEKYASFQENNAYILKPRQEQELFKILFSLEPQHFRVKNQQISQPEQNRFLRMEYSYQMLSEKIAPSLVNIEAVNEHGVRKIDLDFKNIEFNRKLNFPYKIPKGFKALVAR